MKQTYLYCLLFISLFSNAQIINFPDANFKALLLNSSGSNNVAMNLAGNYFKIDTNNDSEISVLEALQVKELNFYTIALPLLQTQKIYSLQGIINFANLTFLYCQGHNLTNLDVNNMTLLETLHVNDNFINSVNLTGAINLTNVNLNTNLLSSLDLSTNINITGIGCGTNALVELNVNNLKNLQSLYCQNNQLTELFIKNGTQEVNLNFSGNNNLNFICCDNSQIDQISSLVSSYSYTNCNFNDYCNFVPGGQFYMVQGQNKLDNENDGCDISDNPFQNLKYSFNNGTSTEYYILNSTGNYNITITNGTYNITPILENPDYFSISPANLVVSFPTQTSPINQDFCISIIPHHDVEVSIIPTSVARPGFDAFYKIIYKNKSNQVENGTINLQFDDALLDLVSTNPAFNSQTLNNLNWTYSDLQPLETRVIQFKMNVNSPMETPAVNGGDILNYTVTNTITNTDEMLSDNTFVLNQTVVNSYDPNDKTCLQGNYVGPDKIGEFVHYMIRFENTGTFPAENIVVKDMIDTAKFDVSSLISLNASHNYVTKIIGNKVEFIFENINLPFDDATNDGYIAFKIKTLPSLVLGDTFSNSANIYFDYNFPIVTNTATTTITALSNPSFEFANYFSLYPNPTTNELNINLKSAIEINSIQIYNTIGQLVTVQTGNALKVDVSNLKTGNYFIKVNTNEGFSTSQFIKK
jgi:hypothetical protein